MVELPGAREGGSGGEMGWGLETAAAGGDVEDGGEMEARGRGIGGRRRRGFQSELEEEVWET